MKKKILFIFLFFQVTTLHAQPQLQWSKIYNSAGTQDDYFVDMKIDAQGNTYMTGYSVLSAFNYNILTLKYNSSGVLQWARTFDGIANHHDTPIGIEIDKNGFIYVAGSTFDSVGGRTTYLLVLIKYNSNGDTIWTKKYNNSIDPVDNFNYAHSFTLDKQGNIFIAASGGGHLPDSGPGYVTIKVDSSGNKLWTKYYKTSATSQENPEAIKTDLLGNVYVAGGNHLGQSVLLKYGNNGDSIWAKFSALNLRAEHIFFDSENNIITDGTRHVAKYNSLGTLIWSKSFASNYSCNDVQMDSNFNLVTTARIATNGSLFATVKYNSNGDSLWGRTYQPVLPSANNPNSIAIDKYRNIYVTGSTDNHTFSLYFRFLTLKYSPDSTFNWAVQYNNGLEADYQAQKILVDTSGNMYVAGSSLVSNGLDIALVKYSQLTAITQISNQVPDKFILSQNYPNPFNPNTKISYELPSANYIELNVFNSLGVKVASLINQKQTAGSYTVDFNSNEYGLSSGVYYYTLNFNGEMKTTKKMILLK